MGSRAPRSLDLLVALAVLLPACGDPVGETAPPPGTPDEAPRQAPVAPRGSEAARAIDLPPDTDATRAARERMVDEAILGAGIRDERVLEAMRAVKRHQFVPEAVRPQAYRDAPLPIGEDQTISQPYVVASMTEEARVDASSRVLEIGTGSGYQAAILAEITPHVFSMEIKEKLAQRAAATLAAAGYSRVRVRRGDGYYGWEEEGPFDAILVTAAAPQIPPPLVRQLARGGRMVVPVGRAFATQDLVLVTKDEEGRVRTRSLYPVRFVPLTGSLGSGDR